MGILRIIGLVLVVISILIVVISDNLAVGLPVAFVPFLTGVVMTGIGNKQEVE